MRTFTAAALAALQAPSVRPVLLCSIQFLTGTSYLWSGMGVLNWNGQNWIGMGQYASAPELEETTDMRATGVTLGLTGIPTDWLGDSLNECRQGLPVQLWIGFFTSAGQLIADPYESFAGRMDVVSLTDSGTTCDLSMTVESRLIDLQRTRESRYTDAEQEMRSPGDTGFRYVPTYPGSTMTWGTASSLNSTSAGQPGGTSSTGGMPAPAPAKPINVA